jgi:hypothetical protein
MVAVCPSHEGGVVCAKADESVLVVVLSGTIDVDSDKTKAEVFL